MRNFETQQAIDSDNHEFLDINNYILQELIGQGSFGKVFKVISKPSGEIYAAKISTKTIDDDSVNLITNLLREINIISRLNHPSVLKFIGYSPINFKNKPKPVIITEFASNGSLKDLICLERNNTPIWDDTRKLIIIYGIASAMSYLHSHNIIHRDLKPDNILLDKFLIPKIADFGLSKMKHSNIASMTGSSILSVKGTPIYMSPEIWYDANYSKAGDVLIEF